MASARTSAQRIISLCPSVTETLFALGAGDRVIGRTRYCIHPSKQVGRVTEVGGTKTVNLARIAALEPDLVIAVREENDEAQVRELALQHDILLLDPIDIPSALDDLRRLGRRLGATDAADTLTAEIQTAFDRLPRADKLPIVYLIWRKPFMAVGGGTYIHALLKRLGLINLASNLPGRYPVLDEQAIERLSPRLVLASTEPFPFREKHVAELQARFPTARPMLVDGQTFSWHGARMKLAARYFERLVPALARAAATP